MFTTVYVPDFAAWALRRLDPALGEKDVIIQAAGRVVARGESLRDRIALGWALERAQAQAPDAVVCLHPGAQLQVAWEALLEEVNRLTPWLEPLADGMRLPRPGTGRGLGSLGSGLGAGVSSRGRSTHRSPDGIRRRGGAGRVPGGGQEARRHLVAEARRQGSALIVARLASSAEALALAAGLGTRVGVAPDRATAALAALSARPGGAQPLTDNAQAAAFRQALPIAWLRDAGIAPATVERLFWLGFATVGSVARLTARQLEAQFDDGVALGELVRGEGGEPVPTFYPPPRIVARHHADTSLCEPAEYEPVLQALVAQAASQLGRQQAQVVSVLRGHDDGGSGGGRSDCGRRVAHEPTSEVRVLSLLARAAMADTAREPCTACDCDELAVVLSGLCPARSVQELLWAQRTRARDAVAAVERRFPGSMLRVVTRDAPAYLPEEACQFVSAVGVAEAL